MKNDFKKGHNLYDVKRNKNYMFDKNHKYNSYSHKQNKLCGNHFSSIDKRMSQDETIKRKVLFG